MISDEDEVICKRAAPSVPTDPIYLYFLFVFKGAGEIKDEYCSYSDYRLKLNNLEKEIEKEKVNESKLSTNKLSLKKTT